MATKEEDLISGEKKLFPGREINVFEKNKIIIVGGGEEVEPDCHRSTPKPIHTLGKCCVILRLENHSVCEIKLF